MTLESIAEKIGSRQLDSARTALDALPESESTQANAMFLRGRLEEACFAREDAIGVYEKVLESDANHTECMFHAALLADQAGDEDTAMDLYKKCIENEPAHVSALTNLALLCEDRGMLKEAEAYLKSILEEYPNHYSTRQLLKSVESSFDMVIDEKRRRDAQHTSAALDQSVADFELSVRSRNCLRQMNIASLGDLLKVTEAELLSYKNFGETSLNEIKAMLKHKGLSLGQSSVTPDAPTPMPMPMQMAGDPSHLNKPVSELELSVRSRKCIQMLGVQSIGELVMRSEAELMATKNFGATSLYEIKNQLALLGISLRGSV